MHDNYPTSAAKCEVGMARRPDVTLRQNPDDQIVMAEKRLDALKATRDRLEGSGILDSRIEDIQQAMRG